MESINVQGKCFDQICDALKRNGKYEELSDLISNLLRLYEKYVTTITDEIGEIYFQQGDIYKRTKRPEEATGQLRKAIHIFSKTGHNGWLVVALNSLGENQVDGSKWSEAQQSFHNVVEILGNNFPNSHVDLANAKRSLGNAFWGGGEEGKAVEIYGEVLRIYTDLGNLEEQFIVKEKLDMMKLVTKL
jgi:tetratricopeptide (TPR) repeat protein